MLMRKLGRTLIATVLCGSFAAVAASSTALAQNRANAGMPAGTGNPHAAVQQQMDQQMRLLYGLQNQINDLNAQVELLSSQVGQGGSDRKLAVYDAIEQKVGDVIGVQQDNNQGAPPVPWVAVTVGTRTFVLQVLPQQLIGQSLWFDGPNCTGNTFVSGTQLLSKGASSWSLAAVHEQEGMVYAADANTAPVQRVVASVLMTNGVCTNFNPTSQKTLTVSPVLPISRFQEPYSVR